MDLVARKPSVAAKEWLFVADPCHMEATDKQKNLEELVYQICIDPDNSLACRLMAYVRTKRRITPIGIRRLFPYLAIRKMWELVGTKAEAMSWIDQKHLRRPIDSNGSGVYHCVVEREKYKLAFPEDYPEHRISNFFK